MEQQKRTVIGARARAGGGRHRQLIAFAAVGAAGAAWLAMHRAPSAPVMAVGPEASPPPAASGASAPAAPPAPIAAASVAPVVPVVPVPARAASAPRMPAVDSAAESLRKVQIALSGGSAQDALMAAQTLEACAHADKMANDLIQSRDAAKWLQPEVRKLLGPLPPVSDDMIARAQSEQRRCQVFDAATLGSRGELFRKAYEGGAPGSAMFYLASLMPPGSQERPDPALIARLQAGVRADAQAADPAALTWLVYGGRYTAQVAGVDAMQMQAYRDAYLRITAEVAPGQAASISETLSRGPMQGATDRPLTARQQQEAQALAQQILDAWHRRLHP
jgi:hypothetical protein